MYFFNQQSFDLKHRYENLRNKSRENENVDFSIPELNDIYNEVVQAFYDKHNLPPLHLWEDGFTNGDAGDEDLIEFAQENPSLLSYDKTDDEIEFDFSKLDALFIEAYEKALEEQVFQYEEAIESDGIFEDEERAEKINYNNYDELKNCVVLDDNAIDVFIGDEIDSFSVRTKDGQHSYNFRSFGNDTTIQCDRQGNYYVSELTLKEELEFYIEVVCDTHSVSNTHIISQSILEDICEKYRELGGNPEEEFQSYIDTLNEERIKNHIEPLEIV